MFALLPMIFGLGTTMWLKSQQRPAPNLETPSIASQSILSAEAITRRKYQNKRLSSGSQTYRSRSGVIGNQLGMATLGSAALWGM